MFTFFAGYFDVKWVTIPKIEEVGAIFNVTGDILPKIALIISFGN